MYNGNTPHRRFGAGQTAGLCIDHGAAGHIVGHTAGIAHRRNGAACRMAAFDGGFQLVVPAAEHHHLFAGQAGFRQPVGQLADLAKSHAAAHDQINPAVRRQAAAGPGRRRVHRLAEPRADRNAKSKQPAAGNAPPGKFIGQFRVRDYISVAVSLLPKGNAGVIGRHRKAGDMQPPVPFQPGQGLGTEQMGGDHPVKPPPGKQPFQPPGHQRVGVIHRRAPPGGTQMGSCIIQGGKKPGRVLHSAHIAAAHRPGHMRPGQQHHVLQHRFVTLPCQFLLNSPGGRIVALPGAAG